MIADTAPTGKMGSHLVATLLASLLLDESWTGHDGVPVLGPEDLSHNDLAEIMGEVQRRRPPSADGAASGSSPPSLALASEQKRKTPAANQSCPNAARPR